MTILRDISLHTSDRSGIAVFKGVSFFVYGERYNKVRHVLTILENLPASGRYKMEESVSFETLILKDLIIASYNTNG